MMYAARTCEGIWGFHYRLFSSFVGVFGAGSWHLAFAAFEFGAVDPNVLKFVVRMHHEGNPKP